MTVRDNLNMIRAFVSAQFIGLEHVHVVHFRRHVEVPHAERVVLQAMHRLIGPGEEV